MMPTWNISEESLESAGGLACFHHCVCSFRPSLISCPALLPRLEQVKRNSIHRATARATRLITLKVMMIARATLETWIGSEEVPSLNVCVGVAISAVYELDGGYMYRSNATVLMDLGLAIYTEIVSA